MSRILVVEDDEDSVFMIRTRLRRMGHEVIVALDGAEGVARARALRPDLVLMDLSLPVLDGWEATRQLKSARETAGIPIIVLSAHAMPGVEERAIEAGAEAYESKPVRMASLSRKIAAALAGRNPAAPL